MERNANRRSARTKKSVRSSSKDIEKDATSVNKLKKRIRDLERSLSREQSKTPANVRVIQERELKTLRSQVKDQQEAALRSHMIGKYHMVRFFERKRALKFLRRAKRNLALAATEDSSDAAHGERLKQLEDEVHNCQVDLNYTLFYPLSQVYMSLYAEHRSDQQRREDWPAQVQIIWKIVEQAMEDDSLESLRNGPPVGEKHIAPHKEDQEKNKLTLGSKLTRSTMQPTDQSQPRIEDEDGGEKSDQEDGGGFFE